MQTLYRKYRPQNFDEVFGQEAIVKVLQKQIEENKVGHAYLFSGPRGTGKTSIARLVAKAVNCTNRKKYNPCKQCSSCLAVEKGRFLDLIEIDAASNRGIEEIRRLREKVGFSPTEGEYKVYIIDEVHMLTKDAFNALLKTLEEPPSHIIFILATTEPHKILPTIISRCQRFNFRLASEKVIFDLLKYVCKKERVQFSKEALHAVVKHAQGSFRDALSILEKVLGGIGVTKDNKVDFDDVRDILGLVEQKKVQEFILALLQHDIKNALELFNAFVDEGTNLFQFLSDTLEYLRELLLQKVGNKKGDYSVYELLSVITALSEAQNKLKFASIERLPIEVAIVKICSGGESSEVEQSSKSSSGKTAKEKKEPINVVKKAMEVLPKISKKKPSVNTRQVEISLEDVKKEWNKIIDKIIPFNHHLSAFFKKAKPIDLKQDMLILQVPYSFHKGRIEERRSQQAFADVTKELLGVSLKCACEVSTEEVEEVATDVLAGNDGVVLEILGDM